MHPQPQGRPTRKGASDLRSAAAPRPGQLPHKTHMRLVCLEMERYRKQQEYLTLTSRAQRCKQRCAEIEVEVRQLMKALGVDQLVAPTAPPIVRTEPKPVRAQRQSDGPPAPITLIHSY